MGEGERKFKDIPNPRTSPRHKDIKCYIDQARVKALMHVD